MYNDINRVTLSGHVGNNMTVSGEGKKPFAAISLATNRRSKKDNQEITETNWHNLVFYNHLAELVKQYVKKGTHLFIEGRIETQKWADENGNAHQKTQIVVEKLEFLNSKKSEEQNSSC